MKAYQSHSIKRQVRRAGTVENVQAFKVKSFTNIEAPAAYRPTINHTTGRVSCTCPDFTYRHARYVPTLQEEAHHCKHLRQTLAGAARRGEL